MNQLIKSKILIAANNPDQMALLTQVLAPAHEIVSTTNELEVLNIALSDPPDLIILDVLMPRRNGYKICADLKVYDKTKHIPVIFISGPGLEENENNGLAFGGVEYITPPLHPAIIRNRVNCQLELIHHRNHLETLIEARTADLVAANKKYQKEIKQRKRTEEFSHTLFRISNAVNTAGDLKELYEAIHRSLGKIIDVSNFCIAIWNPKHNTLEFPFFKDEMGQGFAKISDINTTPSLVGEVLKTGRSLMFTKKDVEKWAARFDPLKILPQKPEIWIGVPLTTKKEIIGVMAVQSYSDPKHYDKMDISILHTVSSQVAIAIERKRSEEELRNSEERFRRLHAASFGGIGIHDKGIILDANKGLSDITGYSYEELIGMNGLRLITPKWREYVMEKIMQNYEAPYDAEGLRKNGTLYPLEIQGRSIPYQDRHVRLTEFRDISVRKRTEEALKESEERYKTLSAMTTEAILFHDNRALVDINHAFVKMFGYSRQELVDRINISQLIEPEYHEGIYKFIETDTKQPFEAMARDKEANLFPIEMEIRQTTYRGRKLWAASIRDISERKRTEENLLRIQKMEAIGTLAGGIAHDFNNMLGGILGNIGLLQLLLPPDSPAFEKIQTIEKIVHRGAELAKQLLGYARGGKYQVISIDLNALINETLAMFGRTRKQLSIYTKFEPHIWNIQGDHTQIEQVLLNLFINAADAMPEGGNLFIETENLVLSTIFAKQYLIDPGKYVGITVRDTGHGMDKLTKAKVFDPFFTTKEVGKGTGLGLASAYGIIKNHNGNIDVHSEIGKGTIFKIYLPASKKDLKKEDMVEKSITKGSGTILLVDDEQEFRDVSEEMLREIGYKIISAGDGKEAIELFKQYQNVIDLVILDVVMPVMGGGETFDRLRAMKPDIKVLLSSGYSADGEAEQILARGCNGFLQKPFRLIKLSERINEIINTVPSQQE